MLIDRSREKLINAIIYFVQNTKYCGKTKLFKLLYFLDFEHFSITGRSVTGLDYYAWPKGPVPVEIFDEIDSPKETLKDAVQVSKKKAFNGKVMNNIVPIRKFSAEHFSKRELKLLEALSKEYSDSYAENMIEATHLENLPWHQVYEVKGLKQQIIPYDLALKKSEYEQAIKNVRENEEFKENYE
ncbi:MAG: SocA family protein [Candidatus Thiodiazotropha endolucinida]|nr:SocA family protein [Candidatus Thiodiazotropha taylori]MCW4318211.1 Panacea domain-containing protein [Candidatus Thiodiazotropha taylori]